MQIQLEKRRKCQNFIRFYQCGENISSSSIKAVAGQMLTAIGFITELFRAHSRCRRTPAVDSIVVVEGRR